MKNAKKVIVLVLCAILLMAVSVMGTLAYLTSTAKVENTFTAGNVTIQLKERAMNPATGALEANAGLVESGIQNIKVVPGRTIEKQPVVIVSEGSEDCWLFVKVEGDVLDAGTFAPNAAWEAVPNEPGWYRMKAKASVDPEGYQVFESFTFNNLSNDEVAALKDKTIVVTAYAVQSELVEQGTAFTTAKGMATPANP